MGADRIPSRHPEQSTASNREHEAAEEREFVQVDNRLIGQRFAYFLGLILFRGDADD